MSAVPNPTGSIVRRRLSADYLRALPKAEVHCHLEGCVPPKTAVRLAERHGVALPAGARDGGDRYRFLNFDEGLEIYLAVCRSMQTAGDFEAVTYESLVTAAEGGLRYREIAFNPQNHPGLTYDEMVGGILAGARAAQEEAGVVSRIVVAINRQFGGEAALNLVRDVLAHPHPEVVAIGLDGDEKAGRPAEFVAAYDLARAAGLKLTAHAGEHGDFTEMVECLDLLGVDRIDHGYAALLDPALLARTVASQIPYSACWFIDYPELEVEGRRRDVAAMAAAGLNMCLNSDDPALIGPELHEDFIDAAVHLEWTVEDAEKYALAGIDASFADDATVGRLRAEFTAELERLRPVAYGADNQ
ncbi:adenosine deaminase [Amycolatopsis bartoniae]|uniref:Adenine deaminase n=1 Tax=Amycolatopsis bartoniae TaxID=941986 RepID=A0A8H9M851_9PSEU|nr:adenosine deaminase [Amycolatopsis bartoniae]GHF32069.1 adenine deaminase [Amycolatopsis bartoniae]